MSEKHLNNLQPGDPWKAYPPTQADVTRIKLNQEMQSLYEGEFEGVLKGIDRFKATFQGARVLDVNFFQTLSQEFSKLLFGEDIVVTVPEKYQEKMDELLASTELQSKLMQISDVTSSIGGCPLKTWRDDNGKVHIDLVSNNIYFPSFDPDDCMLLTGQTLAWERVDTDTNEKFIVKEIHTPGMVQRIVLDKSYNQDDAQHQKWYSGIAQEVATGYDGMLVEYVPNYRYSGSFWGISDYKKIKSIVEEIMLRLSSNADILDKHARPKQVLPAELLDKMKEMLQAYRAEMTSTGIISRTEADIMTRGDNLPRNLDAVYVPADLDKGHLPRMVTWDANMQGAMEQLDRLFDVFLSLSCMTPDVFGISKFGVAESGRALKFRNMRTLAEANRKRQFLLPALKRILRAALSLANVNVELKDIGIVMQDGLPFDEHEATETSATWVSAGLATRVSAIRNARPDITRADAEKEAKEIEQQGLDSGFGDDIINLPPREAVNVNDGELVS